VTGALLLGLVMMSLPPSGGLETIARGSLSAIERPRQVVVQQDSDWRALWRQHAPDEDAPRVDFTTRTVLAVFLGSRNTAGYAVEITRVVRTPAATTARYHESRPGGGQILAQMITAPFHIVSVPRIVGPVSFAPDDGR
jgi:hypothetical protein